MIRCLDNVCLNQAHHQGLFFQLNYIHSGSSIHLIMSANEISALVRSPKMSSCLNSVCLGSDPSSKPLLPINTDKDRLFNPQALSEFSIPRNCWFQENSVVQTKENGSTLDKAINDLSVGVEIDASYGYGPMSISASLKTAFNLSSETMHKVSFATVRTAFTYIKLVLPFHYDQGLASCLNEDVRRNLNSISNGQQALQFLNRYGTYFYQSVSFGGLFTISSLDVTDSSKNSNAMEADLSASLSYAGQSGGARVNTAQENAQERIGRTAKIVTTAIGGNVSFVLKADKNQWYESIRDNPGIIGYKLCPIYELLQPNSPQRKILEQVTRQYITQHSPYEDMKKRLASANIPQIGGRTFAILCNTRNGGLKALEAFPRSDYVGINDRNNSETDQNWKIFPLSKGSFQIRCDTRNGGLKAVEAFPGSDQLRPSNPNNNEQDQTWHLKQCGDNLFQILCNTRNRGLKAMEAFPSNGTVRPKDPSNGESDQKWFFEPPLHPAWIPNLLGQAFS